MKVVFQLKAETNHVNSNTFFSMATRDCHVQTICRISIMGNTDGFNCFMEPNIQDVYLESSKSNC